MFAGCTAEEKAHLQLGDIRTYNYLNQNDHTVEGMNAVGGDSRLNYLPFKVDKNRNPVYVGGKSESDKRGDPAVMFSDEERMNKSGSHEECVRDCFKTVMGEKAGDKYVHYVANASVSTPLVLYLLSYHPRAIHAG